MSGKLVVFDGQDGCGKSSICRAVASALTALDVPHQVLAFPSRDSAVGGLIRDVFDGKAKVHPYAMMWLFVAEGVDMEPTITELLKQGKIVLLDRHTAISGIVYQTKMHTRRDLDAVTSPAGFRTPHRIWIVDVPAGVALSRRGARGEARNVLYEPDDLEKQREQRAAYLNLTTETIPWLEVMNGELPIEDNVKRALLDLGL